MPFKRVPVTINHMQLAPVPESASQVVETILRGGVDSREQTPWLTRLDERLSDFNERLEQVIQEAPDVIAAVGTVTPSELDDLRCSIQELAQGTEENLRDLRSDMDHWSDLLRFYSPEDQRRFWTMIRRHEQKLIHAVEAVGGVLQALEHHRRDTGWQEALGPLLDLESMRTTFGEKSAEEALELGRQQRLLVLPTADGRQLFPAFQFEECGKPYPEIERILGIFAEVVTTPYTIAAWLVSPQDLLDDETPVVWLRADRDPAPLLEAARRSASKLAH